MSWLMSAKRRAREGLLQAVGAHHATEDAEFDTKLRNFTDHVNHLQKVKDSMDLWIEAFDTFGAATLMLSESFKGFFAFKPNADFDNEHPTSSPYLPVASTFAEIARKLNRTILPSVRQLFEIRCLQPLAAILAMIGPIDALLQERKSVLLDFDSYRAKIEKEHAAGRDSRHPLVIKKAMKLDEVAKHLHSVNTTICASFEEFEKARSVTLGPEFSAFMACFFHFSSYSTELSGKVVPHLPQIASSLYVLESFIGQSFADLYTLEGKSTVASEAAPVPAPAVTTTPQSKNKFVKSSASTESPSVVLERTEFAGGSYGGYGSHSTVLPASYKDEAIALRLADAGNAATTTTVDKEVVAAPLVTNVATFSESSLGTVLEETSDKDAQLQQNVEVETERNTVNNVEEAVPTEPAVVETPIGSASFGDDTSASSAPPIQSDESSSSLDLCAPSMATTESIPSTFGSVTMPPAVPLASLVPPVTFTPSNTPATSAKPPPSPLSPVAGAVSTPELPPPPPAAPTSSPAAPARTGFFSSFFSSPARTPLPVAKPVTPREPAGSNSSDAGNNSDADVPMVEAVVDGRPPKPAKPAELRSCSVDYSRSSTPLPAGLQSPPPPPASSEDPDQASNQASGSSSPNPTFRNTIALARGSVEGNLSTDLADRKPLEAGQKPLKPPKALKPPSSASSSNSLRASSKTEELGGLDGSSIPPSGEASPISPAVAALTDDSDENVDVAPTMDSVGLVATPATEES